MKRRWRRWLLAAALVWPLAWCAERALDVLWPWRPELLEAIGVSRQVLAADGRLLRVAPTVHGERVLRVGLEDLSPWLVAALESAEDRRFRSHGGVDLAAMLRAGLQAVRQGRAVSGASTLTMQLARIAEPRPRSIFFKLREAVRARQIERQLDKDTILVAYANLVPIGGTLRGFEAAARYWLGKSAKDLDPAEAATLVAMLPAPSRRSPSRAPDLLRRQRDLVLDAMREHGQLSVEAHRTARERPLGAGPHPWPWLAPHACEVELRERAGERLATSIDLALQSGVESAIARREAGVSDGVAVVVLARDDGSVRALAGAAAARGVELNAALCRRPVGSTLKPFLYALGLELGALGLDSIVLDDELRFPDWRPQNFDETARGALRAWDALVESRNLPAVRLLRALGVERWRDSLSGCGLPLPRGALHLDAALGTLEASPLELARAWQRFASEAACVGGMSRRARESVLEALRRPLPMVALPNERLLAWKTGTSSRRRDAWCAGVTARSVIVVWLGNLQGRGAPDLVGARSAAQLCGAVAALD